MLVGFRGAGAGFAALRRLYLVGMGTVIVTVMLRVEVERRE